MPSCHSLVMSSCRRCVGVLERAVACTRTHRCPQQRYEELVPYRATPSCPLPNEITTNPWVPPRRFRQEQQLLQNMRTLVQPLGSTTRNSSDPMAAASAWWVAVYGAVGCTTIPPPNPICRVSVVTLCNLSLLALGTRGYSN